MIRTTSRRLMTCSFNKSVGRPRIVRASAPNFPAPRGGFFRLGMAGGFCLLFGTALAGPTPIDTQFEDQQILVTLPEPALATTALPADPGRLADLIQAQIQQARSTGDPRFFGYAEGFLQQWNGAMTDRLRVLQATIDQSNHRFERARDQLEDIIETSDSRRQSLQALLILANIDLVQGRYAAAAEHCDQLARRLPGLIAASCQAQVLARTGQPETAYRALQQQLEHDPRAGQVERLWAEGTLGDIAAQLGDPVAETHWQTVLQADPDDLYTRAQLADWYLSRQAPEQTLTLTDGYDQVDSLAVLRAIALDTTGSPDASRLAGALQERFAEAQWRGNLLHKREFARFQLDITGDKALALQTARANWTDQREPIDTRLLLRAAMAAGDTGQIKTLAAWLEQNRQQDARYPEIRP